MQTEETHETLIRAVANGRLAWETYREQHGPWALSSYLFMADRARGFPVLVRCHSDQRVRLIILQNGEEFEVTIEEFETHRGEPFLLTPELKDKSPEAFSRYESWFARAYKTLGLSNIDCGAERQVSSAT